MAFRFSAFLTLALCAACAVLEEEQKRAYCEQYSYYSLRAHEPLSEGDHLRYSLVDNVLMSCARPSTSPVYATEGGMSNVQQPSCGKGDIGHDE